MQLKPSILKPQGQLITIQNQTYHEYKEWLKSEDSLECYLKDIKDKA